MRVERERSGRSDRWSFETTAAVDRAVACAFTAVILVVIHLSGLGAAVLELLRALPP
ncbi:MAG: hypothetical protein M3Q62_10000 [Actinomycetota bacterium]|jgi:hypothetical protein|nr:hypothetical protein [Actinomycetota bacterium]